MSALSAQIAAWMESTFGIPQHIVARLFAYPTQRFYDNAAEGKEGTSIRGSK